MARFSGKPLLRREIAQRDVESAVKYYGDEGGTAVALAFLAALETTMQRISERPGAGSPRYARFLSLPRLRLWPLARYPYLVFYIERADHIDIWRVLHRNRDIPGFLQDDMD